VVVGEVLWDRFPEPARLGGAPLNVACRVGAERYGWRAACVTLGARGCVLRLGGVELAAAGYQVEVADSVGVGDAFAAALIHGIASAWPVTNITRFANHAGAQVAATPGAIPEWSTADAFLR
jgi:sugar/nucleoside kinase (ribokinase family)